MTVLKTTTIVICKNTNFNQVLSEAYIEINQPIFFYNQGIYKNRAENDRFFMKCSFICQLPIQKRTDKDKRAGI